MQIYWSCFRKSLWRRILHIQNVINKILSFKLGGISPSPTMAQICHCVIERREEGRSLVISAGRRRKKCWISSTGQPHSWSVRWGWAGVCVCFYCKSSVLVLCTLGILSAGRGCVCVCYMWTLQTSTVSMVSILSARIGKRPRHLNDKPFTSNAPNCSCVIKKKQRFDHTADLFTCSSSSLIHV